MTELEKQRAIEQGKRDAREHKKKYTNSPQSQNTPTKEVNDGYLTKDKSDFMKNSPKKFGENGGPDKPNKETGKEGKEGQSGKEGGHDQPGKQGREAKEGRSGRQEKHVDYGDLPYVDKDGLKPGTGGKPVGWTDKGEGEPVGTGDEKKRGSMVVRKRIIKDPEGGNGDPTEEIVSPENIDINDDNHMPGDGSVFVDSLCGQEIYNNIQDAIKKAKDSGEDIGIEEINDAIPNRAVSDSQKREAMRKLIQNGIDNERLTDGKPISKENPLKIDPSKYCSFPMLDWRKVLEDFLSKVDLEWETNWYGMPCKHGDFEYDYAWRNEYAEYQEGLGHLVVTVDTSSSVSEQKISLFLNQIGEVLEAAINDDIIVDVVKCASRSITVDRFLHKKGEFAKEASIIRADGERGGTDYTNPLRFFHYMMMDEDDRKKNGYDDFMARYSNGEVHTIDKDLLDLDVIPPATGFIMFTDGDFFSCGKYYGTMEAESAPFEEFVNRTCFFIGLDSYDARVGNVDLWGRTREADDIFKDRIHVCSMKEFWSKYVPRQIHINESYKSNEELFEMRKRSIAGVNFEEDPIEEPGTAQPKKQPKVQKPVEQDDDDIDVQEFIKNTAKQPSVDYSGENQVLVNALENIGAEYHITSADGIVHISGDQSFNDDQMSILGSIHGEVVYTIDGLVDVTGSNCKFMINHAPLKESKGVFVLKDNATVTYEDYVRGVVDKGVQHLVKFVNCANITRGLSKDGGRPLKREFDTVPGIELYRAFTNDANLAIPYIQKYIEAAKRSNMFGRCVPKIYFTDSNGSFNEYVDGTVVDKDSVVCVRICTGTDSIVMVRITPKGVINTKEGNSKFGFGDSNGFPPFVVLDTDKPGRSVWIASGGCKIDTQLLQHTQNISTIKIK